MNEHVQSPEGRDEWRAMVRDYNYAPQKVEEARKVIREKASKLKSIQKDAGLSDWESIGPTGVGGRVWAIATHPTDPDILWLGGVSGGIWKSNDRGATWVPKGDLLPSLAVTSILIHPTSPDTMFVSTGEGVRARADITGSQRNALPGAGIFRSYDGGNTWEKLPSINETNEDLFYWVNKLAWDPVNQDRFYSVGHDKDKDGVDQNFIGGVLHYFSSFGDAITDTERLFARGGFSDIDVSSDGQKIWVGTSFNLLEFEKNQFNDFHVFLSVEHLGANGFLDDDVLGRVELEIAPTNEDIIYALAEDISNTTFGYLMKSIDGGTSWDTMDMKIFAVNPTDDVQPFKNGNGGNQGWYDNTLWVSPSNPNHIIIGGIELWKSLDGGATFSKISDNGNYSYGTGTSPHADYHIIVQTQDFGVSNTGFYVGNDGGIARANNYLNASPTAGWELINNNLSITQFYASDVRPGVGILAGAQDNGTSYFDDSSETWSEVFSGDGGYCGFGQGDTIYFSIQNGIFYFKPEPNSASLGIMNTLTNNPAFIAPMVSFDGGSKVLMADSLLWYSENPTDASSYVNVAPNIPRGAGVRITAIDVDDNNRVAIGYSDGWVLRTNNLNTTPVIWQVIDSVNFSGYVTDIAIHPKDFSTIAVSLGGYRDDNIWITTDAGNAIWQERSNGMPALHVNSLLWHHSEDDWLYAGTDLGVLATEDKGANWNVSPGFGGVSDGPVFTEVTNLQWAGTSAATGARELFVTTYGRGIWKSEDFIRSGDTYFDEDHSGFEFGIQTAPFTTIEQGEAIQAHGQTWHIDGGTYTTSGSVILDKRLGEIRKTGTGSVVIGEN